MGFYPGDRVVGDVLVARRLSWKRIFRDFRVTRTVDRERLESPPDDSSFLGLIRPKWRYG